MRTLCEVKQCRKESKSFIACSAILWFFYIMHLALIKSQISIESFSLTATNQFCKLINDRHRDSLEHISLSMECCCCWKIKIDWNLNVRRSCAICRNENIVVSILIYFWNFSFFCLTYVYAVVVTATTMLTWWKSLTHWNE